jgi:hypothetical protein
MFQPLTTIHNPPTTTPGWRSHGLGAHDTDRITHVTDSAALPTIVASQASFG